uniref:AlkB homolog 6 n=1 Tax=Salmo trutta TaxID=8032 RepID=A0A674E8M2_SALTR
MLGEKLPNLLLKYCERIAALGAFAGKTANRVLGNEYKPGEGIIPHEDWPLYHPTVTTIHLGLGFHLPVSGGKQTEPGLPLGFCLCLPSHPPENMYKLFLHCIQGTHHDSLTGRVANLLAAGTLTVATLTLSTRVTLTMRQLNTPNVLITSVLL